MLFAKLLPKEGRFFALFDQHAAHIGQAAEAFELLVRHYADPVLREKHAAAVNAAERAADTVTTEVNRLIHTTFITPIDREQMHRLINLMDDVADLLQDATEAMTLYDVRHMTPAIEQLTQLAVTCCGHLRQTVALLERVADETTAAAALRHCEDIDRLESEADHAMREAVSRLFRDEPDVRELIKLKAIYEVLETVTDKCEAAANQIEGIVLENA